MRNITLPDGTQVLINSQSTLLYPQQFKGDTRCVYLVGEAGFKVKRDEEHPFIVKSSDFQVTALGTEFNVTAYPDEEEVTATLISGKVLVEYNNQQGQEILKPNWLITNVPAPETYFILICRMSLLGNVAKSFSAV